MNLPPPPPAAGQPFFRSRPEPLFSPSAGNWTAFLGCAILTVLFTYPRLSWNGDDAPASWAKLCGYVVLLLILCVAASWLVWKFSGKSSMLSILAFYAVLLMLTVWSALLYAQHQGTPQHDFVSEFNRQADSGWKIISHTVSNTDTGSTDSDPSRNLPPVTQFLQEWLKLSDTASDAVDQMGSQLPLPSDEPAAYAGYIANTSAALQALNRQIAFLQGWGKHLDELIKSKQRADLANDPKIETFKESFTSDQTLLLKYCTEQASSCSAYLESLQLLQAQTGHWKVDANGNHLFDDATAQQQYDDFTKSNNQINDYLTRNLNKVLDIQKQLEAAAQQR